MVVTCGTLASSSFKDKQYDNRNGAGVGLEADAPPNDARDDDHVYTSLALVHGPLTRRNDITSNSTDSNRHRCNEFILYVLVRT